MLKNILNVNGVKKLDNKVQKSIAGGSCPPQHLSQEACDFCGGDWFGLCLLPYDSPCS